MATEFRESVHNICLNTVTPWVIHKVNHLSEYCDYYIGKLVRSSRWSRSIVDNVVTLQTILGFNEPDQGEQHAMSPVEAAAEWMEIMARSRHDDGDGDDGDCDEYDDDDDPGTRTGPW